MNPLLGAHMSIAGGIHRALERGASIGCSTVQVFLKSNMQWTGRAFTPDEIIRYRQHLKTTGITPVFAHSSYLINLAATNPRFREQSIAALIDEVHRANALSVPFIVMHPGSHLGAGEAAGLRAVAESLDQVFRATRRSSVRIALETTAGQGTNLGYRFEHLAEIYQLVDHPERLAVCVDTCHLFAAGYVIRKPAGYEKTMQALDATIGYRQVVAFHLNDSKKPLGSRVDRHEHIGKGHLGRSPFRSVLRDPRWRDLPMVLETPKEEDLKEDVENLTVLRSLMKTGH